MAGMFRVTSLHSSILVDLHFIFSRNYNDLDKKVDHDKLESDPQREVEDKDSFRGREGALLVSLLWTGPSRHHIPGRGHYSSDKSKNVTRVQRKHHLITAF